MAVDIVILAVLILLNGFFSLSEMAIVSSRRQRLLGLLTRQQEAGKSSTGGIELAISLNLNTRCRRSRARRSTGRCR
ncbi:MAG: hypothetical protein RLO21_19650, partial [Nitratireductor sp.]